MKKVILILISLFFITGCRSMDSILFKEAFEKENYNNSIEVSIPSDNPIVYITEDELSSKIEKEEDITIFFGYPKSKETRSMVENLILVLEELKMDTIYYLDILEIRDEKQIINGEVKIIKNGTEGYNKLLELLKNSLKDYIVDNQVVGKRIYAPTVLKIRNKQISITNGLSETADFENYTSEMKKESYDIIYNFLKENQTNVCDITEGC